MNFKYYPLLLLLLLLLPTQTKYLRTNSEGLREYTIDLDIDPKESFKEPTKDLKAEIKLVKKLYEHHYTFFFRVLFKSLGFLVNNFQEEHIQEIQGIAEELDANYHNLLILNFFYEISSFCTSSIVRTQDG